MNENRRKPGRTLRSSKRVDAFSCEWLGHPPARVAREELNCVASSFFRDYQRFMKTTFDRRVESNFLTLHLLVSSMTRSMFPPRILSISVSEYPRFNNSLVKFGKSATDLRSAGTACTPSKSDPMPT